MTLEHWFSLHGIPIERALCLSVASDGFSLAKANMLSVSVWSGMLDQEPETYYVEGANPEKVEEHTGVDLEYYLESMLGVPRVEEILEAHLATAEFIVTYSAKRYTRPWLNQIFHGVTGDLPWLDVVDLMKLAESDQFLPMHVSTIDDLSEALDRAFSSVKGGYSLDAILTRVFGEVPFTDGRTSEDKVRNLRVLWDNLKSRNY